MILCLVGTSYYLIVGFIDSSTQTEEVDSLLTPTIAQALLGTRGIKSFYAHQAAAILALSRGKHVVVSTSTASGKSLIYQVFVLTFPAI